MSNYELDLPNIGKIKVMKKRGMRTMRLRINSSGSAVVSAPWYVPRTTIASFVISKQDWLLKHLLTSKDNLYDGMMFGRNMTLYLHEYESRQRSRLLTHELHLYFVDAFDKDNEAQQDFARKNIYRALKNEAEIVLLPRLQEISERTKQEFNQAYVKHLTGRWGSCDQSKNILLSFFLVQLPQHLIDYVIIHELAHTTHMNHSRDFWNEVAKACPDYRVKRAHLKSFQPRIIERI